MASGRYYSDGTLFICTALPPVAHFLCAAGNNTANLQDDGAVF